MRPQNKTRVLASHCAGVTVPELEQSKAAVLSTLASAHSRRSYKHAIEKFIDWYCSEPRLGFNRSVVLRYRTFLEGLTLSAAMVNLHLSAIRRLADEAAESGWLSPELAIGIRRVKGVKRLGRRIGNWLTGHQAQDLVNAISQGNPSRDKRCCNDRTATRMWSATLRNRELKIGSAAIAAEPLGDRRYAWEGRKTANGSCADLV